MRRFFLAASMKAGTGMEEAAQERPMCAGSLRPTRSSAWMPLVPS